MQKRVFQKKILKYYQSHKRDFPWRPVRTRGRRDARPTSNGITPYHILVSEVMLQQTQTDRVVPKFRAFIKKFPNVKALARAPQREVLLLWSGLGYNRRALNLHKAAKMIVEKYKGVIPREKEKLVALPAVGPYTAGAIRTFAFNQPDTFLETNIRTVFIHFFFKDSTKVNDREILYYVEKMLYAENPRLWYSALMDYGAMLKREGLAYNAKSKHYTKQSRFEGSDRKIRGAVLRMLLAKGATIDVLVKKVKEPKERVAIIVHSLVKEDFIIEKKKGLFFMKS